MMDEALEYLNELLVKTPEFAFGGIYEAIIHEIQQKGILVTLYEGMKPILVHNSQLDSRNVSVLYFSKFKVLKVEYYF